MPRRPSGRVFSATLAAVLLHGVGGTVDVQAQPAPPISAAPVVNYEYDALGNRTRLVQAQGAAGFGFATQGTYDGLNRLSIGIDARNKATSFGYNGREDLTSVTDPRLLLTQYSRNGLGDATSLLSPDTGTATHTYDAAGNLKTRTDSRGVLATYRYDALNRLTGVVYSKTGQTSITQTWSYDQIGTGYANGVGRLTSTNTPVSSSQYTYDAQGRVLTDIQRVKAATGANSAQVGRTVTYTYDAAGNVAAIVYPSGRKLSIGYASGVPSSMSLARNSTAAPTTLLSAIQWQPFGAASSWLWQMGAGTKQHERAFDTSGRVVRYPLGLHLRDVTYDAADRIVGYTHYLASTGAAVPLLDQSFSYDEVGRLTGVATASASWSIGYDDNGNRTGVTLNGVPSSYTVATTSNRLSAISNPVRSFGYDNAGNTTTDGQFTATYDLTGRLSNLTKAGITTTFAIDGFGRRVRKFNSTGASSTVIFVYDLQGRLLGEYGSTGTPLREYVWLGDTPVAMFVPNPAGATLAPLVYYIHTDHIETPRAVVDTAGNLRWNWFAEPFGTTVADGNPKGFGAFTFNLRMPGQLFDAESGLHYNYFRDYDPTIGRYTQSDPIGLAGGINTYAYVGGNPVSNIDPTGLLCNWTQSTGAYSCYDPTGNNYASGTGYAGAGADKNNPGSQNIFKKGPLPKGCYKVSGIENGSTGPYSLRLMPLFKNDATNSNRDLGSFLIHGDSIANPGTASEGCPIMPGSDRRRIPLGEVFCVN